MLSHRALYVVEKRSKTSHQLIHGCVCSPSWPSGKASASRAADRGSIPALAVRLFSGRVMSRTLVAALLGAWRYRVSVGTGWPGVSVL